VAEETEMRKGRGPRTPMLGSEGRISSSRAAGPRARPGAGGRDYCAPPAGAGRDETPSLRRRSQAAQSMLEKNASMYFGRSAGL